MMKSLVHTQQPQPQHPQIWMVNGRVMFEL